ncbi:hypothetical protein HZC07_04005 [Candidatus Micrarchaeota archaeon]|nr:hypothetical protein [Candidatus Micrarchaeota archaeon]
MRFMVFLFSIILLLGCLSPSVPSPKPVEKNQTVAMTCNQFCSAQTCNGNLTVSGSYPICNCECIPNPPPINASTSPVQTNLTNASNISSNLSNKTSVSVPLNFTNKSVSQFLAEGINSTMYDFYNSNDGSFNQQTYSWQGNPNTPSNSITVEPYNYIKFEDVSESKLAGIGFTVFEPVSLSVKLSKSYGVAVVASNQSVLDTYRSPRQFYFNYFSIRELTSCTVYLRNSYQSASGILTVYNFRCLSLTK